jgi:WD40 repeat protein
MTHLGPWPPVGLFVWDRGPNQLIVAGSGNSLLFWDLHSGELLDRTRIPISGSARTMVSLPRASGTPLLAVAGGHHFSLWDGSSPKAATQTPVAVNRVAAITSPDRHALLATGGGTGVHLWDPNTLEVVHRLITAAPVTGIAHRHDGGHHLWFAGPAGIAALTGTLPST